MISVIPVIVTAIWIHLLRFVHRYAVEIRQSAALCVFLAFLFFTQTNFSLPHPTSNIYSPVSKFLVQDVEKRLVKDQTDKEEAVNLLFLSNMLLGNFYDYTAYFFPNARVYYQGRDNWTEADTSLPTYVVDGDKLPSKVLEKSVRDIREESAYDERRDQTFTWYCGRLDNGT